MPTAALIVAQALLLSFVLCCVVSGLLQLLAWSRHSRPGRPRTLRALLHPEEHFDAIGVRQMLLARRLLTVGAVAYLSYGVMVVVGNVLG